MQVRERSARSVPMGKGSLGRSSFSATSDSLSDNEGSFSRGPPTRKSSAPLRSSLTPGTVSSPNDLSHYLYISEAYLVIWIRIYIFLSDAFLLIRWKFTWEPKQQQTTKQNGKQASQSAWLESFLG